ncbi:hypothetical protein [Halobacterium salinarum]|uniref:hypothetical protein n=1 Tax=Halobacterium salinarum TaxID=2242 RepID=UPI001F2103DE|nr:hypothetical protein [Halobacterium salinarum]MCF2165429.1 hypothetical protein [Halobacterium salinarum]MCF2168294.1 hypothetical protein [Halobacterium salinarum]
MAQGDTDPHDAEPAIDPADLIRLKVASNETSWVLNMTQPLRAAGIQGGDHVDVDLLWEDDGPMLVFGRIPADVAETDDAGGHVRTVTDRGTNLSVKPPCELIEANSEYGAGLGLDRSDYDNDDPLCFDVLVDDGLVALAPMGHKSTLNASSEPEADGSTGSEPSSKTDATSHGHPLTEDAVSAAAQATGVPVTALRDALGTVAADADVDEIETAADYDALDVDDRRVLVVPDRVWSDIQTRAGFDEDVFDAARLAHTRMAETLVFDASETEYRRFSQDYDALVVSETVLQ